MPDIVKAWAEEITIPTYKIGTPDRNPMFLEKRVYQGSSGVVYPHPVIDKIYDEKEDKSYTALFLENRYLKLMVLPEIGGRLQMALDKTNGRQFVYYNRVIKPALVGLAGPWISGGIEFNWPQHHRPSTFAPLDWWIQQHKDGSKTVWCAEIEVMFGTKGMHGFRLYPERAYFEVNVQLYNRTDTPQTFLWWANPAVAVHDQHQSVFPQDVHAVMDHGKRDVSSFPIATGTYYKVDYSPGTDISRYKNIPVPTSYMVYHSDYDFVGDYDHRDQAGMLHIANHHVVPGKKQWTWGNGDFGQAWDRQLTDEDGPYVELMCGAYTDNQPDFSWIQPGEEKTFQQVFMPYKEIGPAHNASRDFVLNLEVADGQARLGVYASCARSVTVQLAHSQDILFERQVALDPETTLVERVNLPSDVKGEELTLAILDGEQVLLSYSPPGDENIEIPSPATAARPPQEIESVEELYLNGLHLEQYRHATYEPEPYYLEALRRDSGDSRSNNALGRLLYRRGRFAEAEPYFRKAIERLTLRNPNPADGEHFYNLGLSLRMQGKYEEAYAAFHKAVWNAAWAAAAYFELARLSSWQGQPRQALAELQHCLDRNGRHYKARHLRIALLRQFGEEAQALAEADHSLALDPLEYGALWERHLLVGDPRFDEIVGEDPVVHIELALDYAHAGLFDEASRLLERVLFDTMSTYTLGWVLAGSGQDWAAQSAFRRAASLACDYCFPNRLEDVLILETALRFNPQDARAAYYLGDFWYAHRQYEEAINFWEKSVELDGSYATAHRNLGLAYFNKRQDSAKALACFERAFALNPTDGRVFFELDQLYKRLNRTPAERLAVFKQYLELVAQRDDLTIEYIALLFLVGQFNQAYRTLMRRTFHPWEGGEGKVTRQYVLCLIEKARKKLADGDAKSAVRLLTQAQYYPHSLGEGKLYGTRENHIFYHLGLAYEMLGKVGEAQAAFRLATSGSSEPVSAMYYNDQPPDMIFYQGLAYRRLGHPEQARTIFQKLVDYGRQHLDDRVKMDYFAVSLPDFLVFDMDLDERNRTHCHYMQGLGYLGLGNRAAAHAHFEAVLAADANHIGVASVRRLEG